MKRQAAFIGSVAIFIGLQNDFQAARQDPWANNNKILGIATHSSNIIYYKGQSPPRAAILVNGRVNTIPITQFIHRDIVAIMVEVPTLRGKTEICIASAYFPGDVDDEPSSFVSYCRKQNKTFSIGCDANAYHTIWASTDINNMGKHLLDFIYQNVIDIGNRGDVPTFTNAIRQAVLDLMLCSPTLSKKINNWHVSDEISLSDHKQIIFENEVGQQLIETTRNPRETNWELYSTKLSNGMDN